MVRDADNDPSVALQAAAYFLLAHRIHQTFDTLSLLEAADVSAVQVARRLARSTLTWPPSSFAGIQVTPSEEITYSLTEIKAALAGVHPNPEVRASAPSFVLLPILCRHRVPLQIHCDDTQSLVSITYPLTLSPPAYTPGFAPLSDAPSIKATCPDDGGIWYHPSLASRTPINRGKRIESKTWDPIYRPSPRPITLKSAPSPVIETKRAEPTKAQKLGIFAGVERRREQDKEGRRDEAAWGKRRRDEL